MTLFMMIFMRSARKVKTRAIALSETRSCFLLRFLPFVEEDGCISFFQSVKGVEDDTILRYAWEVS